MDELNFEFESNLGDGEDLRCDCEEVDDDIKIEVPVRRKKKPIISPDAHPLTAFMMTYDFGWGELAGITLLSRDELLGIIRGDSPTDFQRTRIAIATGVKI